MAGTILVNSQFVTPEEPPKSAQNSFQAFPLFLLHKIHISQSVFYLINKWTGVLMIKQKIYNWQMLHVSKMCTCSYNQTFQSSNNGVIRTLEGLIEILWRKIKASSDNLHQFNYHFKSHADSQRIAWCIAGLVLQLLKPLLNHRLAYGLIRKMWIRFL